MAAPYPTRHPATEDALWSEICAVAHGEQGSGLLVRDGQSWQVKGAVHPGAQALADLFLPLLADPPTTRPMVVAHLAQSLDGRIARPDGESHWITGEADLDHTHRLRAISDAVMVGAETVIHDDCRLTVRRCSGPQPTRIILDPTGRVPNVRNVFSDGEAPTLWVCASGAEDCVGPGVECVQLPAVDGMFQADDLLDALKARGIRRVFVEGGGRTVAYLMQAGVLDRLHLAVAPLLMGDGRNTLSLALGAGLADCPRPQVNVHPMGDDWLFDCDFRSVAQ